MITPYPSFNGSCKDALDVYNIKLSVTVPTGKEAGDLPPYNVAEQCGEQAVSSWRELIVYSARTVYPAYGIKCTIGVLP